MGSRTISLDDEAYGLLRDAKIADESFSDVVKRTFGAARPRLASLAGLLSAKDADAIQRLLASRRAASKREGAARRAHLWGGRA